MSDEVENGAAAAVEPVAEPAAAVDAQSPVVAPVSDAHPAVAAIANIEANLGPLSANQGGLLEWLKRELAELKRLF